VFHRTAWERPLLGGWVNRGVREGTFGYEPVGVRSVVVLAHREPSVLPGSLRGLYEHVGWSKPRGGEDVDILRAGSYGG
jgi:hypothetical protein